MPQTYNGGLTLTWPKSGERGWGPVFDTFAKKIADHDHSGNGNGRQLSGTALSPNSFNGGTFRLNSLEWLRSRNVANTADLNLLRSNAADELELGLPVNATLIKVQKILVNVTTPDPNPDSPSEFEAAAGGYSLKLSSPDNTSKMRLDGEVALSGFGTNIVSSIDSYNNGLLLASIKVLDTGETAFYFGTSQSFKMDGNSFSGASSNTHTLGRAGLDYLEVRTNRVVRSSGALIIGANGTDVLALSPTEFLPEGSPNLGSDAKRFNNLFISGQADVGSFVTEGDGYIGDDLQVIGDANITGALTVVGNTTLSNLTVSGAIIFPGLAWQSWTPTIFIGGLSSGVTTSIISARYAQIGKIVHFNAQVRTVSSAMPVTSYTQFYMSTPVVIVVNSSGCVRGTNSSNSADYVGGWFASANNQISWRFIDIAIQGNPVYFSGAFEMYHFLSGTLEAA